MIGLRKRRWGAPGAIGLQGGLDDLAGGAIREVDLNALGGVDDRRDAGFVRRSKTIAGKDSRWPGACRGRSAVIEFTTRVHEEKVDLLHTQHLEHKAAS